MQHLFFTIKKKPCQNKIKIEVAPMMFPFNSIMWGFSYLHLFFLSSSSLGVSGQRIQFDTFLTELSGCLTKSIRCMYTTGSFAVYFDDKVWRVKPD